MGKKASPCKKERVNKQNKKKSQNRNQKNRFIQLFIPHCTAMCQSKGGGSDQSQARKISKMLWLAKSFLSGQFSPELLARLKKQNENTQNVLYRVGEFGKNAYGTCSGC